MLLAPDILHEVGYAEAQNAVRSEELIASCTLAHQVIDDALRGVPHPSSDSRVVARSDCLIGDAEGLIEMIGREAPGALDGDPGTLARGVRGGYFDAPYLAGIPAARGAVVTVAGGGCDTVDLHSGFPVSKLSRVADQHV